METVSLIICFPTIIVACKMIFLQNEDLNLSMRKVNLKQTVYLFTVLFKHSELETLVQFVLLDVPELEELLLARVDLVEELHDAGDAGLQVRVESHVAGRAVSAAVATVVTVTTLTR